MDLFHNPFSPGAGRPPPELVGRGEILQQALVALGRVKRGRAEKSILIVGLRGTGKTVLLREIAGLAQQEQYQAIMIEAREKKSLPEILLLELRQMLFSLDRGERVSAKVKRAFSVFKSFLSTIKRVNVKIQDIDIGMDIEAEKGTADSGDLEADLTQLFIALGEAAQDKQTAIAIIIDELQYLHQEELSALIMAIHIIVQKALPIVLIGAGLPQLIGHVGHAKSYAERLFSYPKVGPLKTEDAKAALQKPVQKEGVMFTEEALDEIVRVTEGYPYFLQEWGYQAWNLAKDSSIDIHIARQATSVSIDVLDQNFFLVRFDKLTPREKEYLRALAEWDTQSQRSGEVADKLGIDVQHAASIRNSLIKKGIIYSPAYGNTAFTVPLFGGFMKRVMPDFVISKKREYKQGGRKHADD